MVANLTFTPITNIVADFSDASKINSILYELIEKHGNELVKGGGKRTDWSFAIDNKDGIEELDLLFEWIEGLIPRIAFLFAVGHGDNEYDSQILGFNPNSFEICESWGIHYNRGEGVWFHNHFPYNISFVYYVKTPEGSSPLILDNEEMFLEEGQIVFFLGHQFHCVEKNNVDGRCIIAGNLLYNPK